jgi:UDP-N-acetylglucosamine 2-epimerase (non-hydrolysing)
MKKVAIILGTRPEIIKISPIIRELIKKKADFFIIHTNQHYDTNLDKIFFSDLNLPKAKYNLKIGSHTRSEQIKKMVDGIVKVLKKEMPDVCIVQGDTNTVLAGALASNKLDIKIAHVEAGLRSYDMQMPEEINRIETDKISDWLFAPTAKSAKTLKKEKLSGKIIITGNTIVDAVLQNKKLITTKHAGKYAVLTMHRPANVDSFEILNNTLKGLAKIPINIIWPIHPRARKSLKKFRIVVPKNIKIIDPIGYLDFLGMQKSAQIIFTDSGGIQEEACILKVPCVTLRKNTERPETIDVKSNILVGSNQKKIIDGYNKMIKAKKNWKNPFGDGKASQRIVAQILK